MRIQKTRKKNVHWASRGHETQFSSKFGAETEFAPVLSFSELLQPITAAAMCTVTINVPELGAFSPESQYFIPRFNKIS